MRRRFQLKDLPTDYVSSVRFHEIQSQILLAASWDSTVRLYDIDRNQMLFKWTTDEHLMDSIFVGTSHIAYGGRRGILKVRDPIADVEVAIGHHDDVIRNIEWLPEKNAIVTGSLDKTIKIWDLRKKESVSTYNQSDGGVTSMSVVGEKIGVATSKSHGQALIWDLRNMKSYLIRHNLNDHPLNCIAISPNKESYVMGSSDGRVALEYIKRDPEIRNNRATFFCHQMLSGEELRVFGVNAVVYFDGSGVFATGGGNGFVNLWDGVKKKYLAQITRHKMPIISMALSPDRKKLAVTSSERMIDNIHYRPLISTIKVSSISDRYFEEQTML